jgi:hypothetical protein
LRSQVEFVSALAGLEARRIPAKHNQRHWAGKGWILPISLAALTLL